MENNELVVYGNNGEIVDCKFQRVDLNTPSTILSYCSDVKDAISNILDSTSQMAIEVNEEQVTEAELAQIPNLGESLEESEKSKNKNTLVKSIKGFLGKLGIDAFKEVLEEDTYASRYREYCDMLSKIADSVESQKQNTLNDIELKNNIINEMMPLIQQLEIMIKVGIQDKQVYDEKTEELKATADPNDIDVQHQIQYRTQISAIFNNKLNELEKVLIAYKGQIQIYRVQQNSDMELVMANESYLSDAVPLLKANGSSMVLGKIQEKRMERQKALDAATNQALIQNAKQLQVNAQSAVDLSVNGRVTIDALKQLEASVKAGAQVLINGKKAKQQKNEQERKELQNLSRTLTEYNEELLNLIEGNEITAQAIGETKRIGGK